MSRKRLKSELRYFELTVTKTIIKKYKVLGRDCKEAMYSYNITERAETVPEKIYLGEQSNTIEYKLKDIEYLN